MGGVEDQLEIVLSGQGFQRLDVRGQAEGMYGRDADGARRDQAPGVLDVDAVGPRVHVGEDGLQAVPHQGVDRRTEGEARNDHLTG